MRCKLDDVKVCPRVRMQIDVSHWRAYFVRPGTQPDIDARVVHDMPIKPQVVPDLTIDQLFTSALCAHELNGATKGRMRDRRGCWSFAKFKNRSSLGVLEVRLEMLQNACSCAIIVDPYLRSIAKIYVGPAIYRGAYNTSIANRTLIPDINIGHLRIASMKATAHRKITEKVAHYGQRGRTGIKSGTETRNVLAIGVICGEKLQETNLNISGLWRIASTRSADSLSRTIVTPSGALSTIQFRRAY